MLKPEHLFNGASLRNNGLIQFSNQRFPFDWGIGLNDRLITARTKSLLMTDGDLPWDGAATVSQGIISQEDVILETISAVLGYPQPNDILINRITGVNHQAGRKAILVP